MTNVKRTSCFLFLILALTAGALQAADAAPFPGDKSSFHGFDRYDFIHNDRACIIVAPKTAAAGKPWMWRARFFGHEPQTDVALLRRGFHVAYVDVAGLFGAPKAVAIWDQFYAYLMHEHGLNPQPVLEGMSRGGLIVYNWAARHPEKVACVYADAPVCDIRSWPGGQGTAPGHAASWAQCLEAYGLSAAQARTATCNPIDHLEPLARDGVPLLHVVGDADEVVPVEENTAILEQRYKALGGSIQVIRKPGIGHHPHSLTDPTPIVEFILAHAPTAPVRERIEWCDIWITNADREDLPRVLLIGDSITRGYFGGVENALQGKANCARLTTSRCICDPVFFDELTMVLRQYRFAVIHFNNGLHGFGYTETQYRRGFARLMSTLQEHRQGAQLIWTTTTPVREKGQLETLSATTARVRERNRIAQEFVERADLPVDDLFALAIDHPEYHAQDGVHFNGAGKKVQVEQVARIIAAHLPEN